MLNQAANQLSGAYKDYLQMQNAATVRTEPLDAARGIVVVGRFDRAVEIAIQNVAWMTDCSLEMKIDRRFLRKTIRFKLSEYRAGQAKDAAARLIKLGIATAPEIGPR
jgi:hypothetical protein